MGKAIKKLFGGLNLTWPKVIIAAILAGAFTAVMAIIPTAQNTSFSAITVTFEVWILFGIIIIMNSKSNLDAALKCFVFFLISQPLVYLIQVPFSDLGWSLFGYYRYWFLWTLFCFPMGFVGYYMKKGKWWGYLILLPMIVLTGHSYMRYFSEFQFAMPRYILITLFCACAMILYPVLIFKDKRIKTVGALIGAAAVVVLTVLCLRNPPVYSTEVLANGEETQFDDSYSVYLADERFGDVDIRFVDGIEDYMVHAEFKKAGDTVLALVAPDGGKREFNIHVERDTYEVEEIRTASSAAKPEAAAETDKAAPAEAVTAEPAAAEPEVAEAKESTETAETAESTETAEVAESTAVPEQAETLEADAVPAPAETESSSSSSEAEEVKEAEQNGFLVVLDPGHTAVTDGEYVSLGPGSEELKLGDSGGTNGVASGLAEYELTMTISQKLREELQRRGYQVLLTHEDNNTPINCDARAIVANEGGADCFLRIHADGVDSNTARGAMAICITQSNPWNPQTYAESRRLSDNLLQAYCAATGVTNRGVSEQDNMTGNNWSEVPCSLVELGFMTTPEEDLQMADPEFQVKMVQGLADGLDLFFGIEPL